MRKVAFVKCNESGRSQKGDNVGKKDKKKSRKELGSSLLFG